MALHGLHGKEHTSLKEFLHYCKVIKTDIVTKVDLQDTWWQSTKQPKSLKNLSKNKNITHKYYSTLLSTTGHFLERFFPSVDNGHITTDFYVGRVLQIDLGHCDRLNSAIVWIVSQGQQ